MSDAIKAAAKALISAQRDMFPGGGWFALDDAKTLVIAALTAYEAAKGGGVAWRYFTRRHMPGHHDSGGEVVVPFSNDDEMAAIHAALTSPASEVEQIIAASTRMAKRLGVAFEVNPAKVEQFIRGTSPASGPVQPRSEAELAKSTRNGWRSSWR